MSLAPSANAFLKLPDPCTKSLYACPVPAALVTGSNERGMFGITWRNTVIEVYTDQGIWLGDAEVDRLGKNDVVSWNIDIADKLTDGKHYLFFITYNLSKRDRSYKSDVFPFYLNYTGVVLRDRLIDENTTDKAIITEKEKDGKTTEPASKTVEKEVIITPSQNEQAKEDFQNTIPSVPTDTKGSYGTVIGYAIIGIFVVLIIVAIITRRDDEDNEIENKEIIEDGVSWYNKFLFILRKTMNTCTDFVLSLWNYIYEKISTKTPNIKEKISNIILSIKSYISNIIKNTRLLYDAAKTKIENIYNESIIEKEDNKKE